MSVADFDRPAQRSCEASLVGHTDHPVGSVEDDALDVCVRQQRHDLAGCDDLTVGQLAQVGERVGADEDREQWARSQTSLCCGAGAVGHLDERVGSALGGGAVVAVGQVVHAELLHQPGQLLEEGGAADRIEQGPQIDHPVQRGRGGGAA